MARQSKQKKENKRDSMTYPLRKGHPLVYESSGQLRKLHVVNVICKVFAVLFQWYKDMDLMSSGQRYTEIF